MGLELMIPGQVLGMATLAAAEPRAAGRDGAPPARPGYEERVCGATPVDQHQADPGRVEMRRSYRMDALVEADVVVVPGTYRAAFDARILFRPFVLLTVRSFSCCATHRSLVASTTSGGDPPPTHLADVLDGFVGHFREQPV